MKKKIFSIIMVIAVVSMILVSGLGESDNRLFDIEQYSLDELKQIKEQVDDRISDLERQWAIEHGDRTITFEEQEITLFTKRTKKVVPIVTRVVEDAPKNTTFIWSSSDQSIAKVSAEGTITAVAYGDAVITATAKDNDCIFGSLVVHVVLPVTKLTIEESNMTLLLNEESADAEADLHVRVEPENAYHQTVTWKSSKESIVSVDEKGHIKGLEPGTATITATSTEPAGSDGTVKKASLTVTVVQAVMKINLSDEEVIIDKGKTKKIKATVSPDNATKKNVTWTSSNTGIATVTTDGTITAKACGECYIICSSTDGSKITASCHVIIKQLVTSIKLSETSIVLASQKVKSITATISPADATSKKVQWTSSNTNVATVIAGKITANKGGDCVITCTALDGSGKSASINVHVPTFSVDRTEYTVFSKNGLTIPINVNGNHSITITYSSPYFDAWKSGNSIFIYPYKAGTGSIKLSNKNAKQDDITIKITIDHSAVYDTTSYPKASYKDILRYPSSYRGSQVQIYGKVIQKVMSGSTVVLRVGTSGYGYYDSVFWVEYTTDQVAESVIEDDYITVYGNCTGTYTYTATFGQSITIPSIKAERIDIGRKY